MASDPKDAKTMMAEAPKVDVKPTAGGQMGGGLPPPPAPPPPAGGPAPSGTPVLSSQKTMMMDPAAQQKQVVVPTMMRERPTGGLPAVRKPRREIAWGRWIGGPILAAIFAGATFAGAPVVLPKIGIGPKPPPPPKPQGRLRLNSDPPGASILVDGKVFPHFTPTVVEGDVGATLHVTFKLDGYNPKEADVAIADGEHAFGTKLDRAAPPPPAPAPTPAPAPSHHHSAPTPKEPAGFGTISVFVRPWAIVYVDGTRLRQTPVQAFKLPAGKHVIELVNEGKNRREKVQLQLKPDAAEEIKRDWDKE
jgi:hypothetical protein